MPTLRFLLLALIAGLSLPCWSAPGEVDSSFTVQTSQVGKPTLISLQRDGRLLINTQNTEGNVLDGAQLARLHMDGEIDQDFVAGPRHAAFINDILIQPDGKVLVARDAGVVRLLPDGSVDGTFQHVPLNTTVFSQCLAMQADGKILVGQYIAPFDSQSECLWRLHPNGTIDASFHPQVSSHVGDIAIQVDGKILVAGEFTTVSGKSRKKLVRLHSDGRLDDAFQPHPDDSGAVACMAVLPDGKILVGGRFSSMGGVPMQSIARLNADGSRDLAFQARISYSLPEFSHPQALAVITDLVVQADGKIIIVGNFGPVDGVVRQDIARLCPDGKLDASFVPPADRPSSDSVGRVILQPNGRALMVMSPVSGSSTLPRLLRLQNDPTSQTLTVSGGNTKTVRWLRGGSAPEVLDAVFELSQDFGRSYTPLGLGKRIAGGWEISGLSLPLSGQIRASSNTAGCRGGFGASQFVQMTIAFGRVPVPEITVEETLSGQVIEDGGAWTIAPANPGTLITRTLTIRNHGDLDLKLLAARIIGPDAGAFVITRYPASRVQGGGGSTLLAVEFTPSTTLGLRQATLQLSTSDRSEHVFDVQLRANVVMSDDATLRDLRTGQTDPSYEGMTFSVYGFDPGTTSYTKPFSTSDENLNIVPVPTQAGAVVKINGVAGRVLWNLQPGLNHFTIKVTAQDGVTGKIYTLNVNRSVPSPGVANAVWAVAEAQALALEPDGSRIIGGAFTLANGQPAPGLLRVRSDGERDLGYLAGIGGDAGFNVKALSLQPDLKLLVAGSFSLANGVPRANLARFDRDGTLDASFDTSANGVVEGLVRLADGGVLLIGTFTAVASEPRQGIARLAADGTLDLAFAPAITGGAVLCAAVQSDGGIVIGGTFTEVDGSPRQRLAKLLGDGTLDTAFAPTADEAVQSVVVQPDGQLLISGAFNQINVATRPCLARLSSAGGLDTGFNPALSGPTANTRLQALLQADGKVLAGGQSITSGLSFGRTRFFSHGGLDGSFSPGNLSTFVAGLLQDDGFASSVIGAAVYSVATGAPVESLQVQSSRIDWQRGGSLPEALDTWFDLSTDGGSTFSHLGKGTRMAGGWTLTGLALPANGLVRARASIVGGNGATCSGIVESVAIFGNLVAAPEIAVLHNGGTVPDGSSLSYGVAYAQEKNLLPLAIKNTGDALLRLTDFTFTGPDANKFSIGTYPLYETNGPSGVSTLMVQVEAGTPGPVSATLHIESNDADEGSYDIELSAILQTSRNASLSGLTLDSSIASTPSFSSAQSSYRHTINPSASTVRVRPTAGQLVAGITVNGQVVASGSYSSAIPVTLGVDATTITVVVTALDGVTTRTYALLLTRHPGGLAQSFNSPSSTFNGEVYCSAEQPGGQTIMGGPFYYLTRFHVDGARDESFSGRLIGSVECLATFPDASWLTGGDMEAYVSSSLSKRGLLRYQTDGVRDESYQSALSGAVRCLVVQPDGKVLVGGNFSAPGPNPLSGIARLNVDGALDTSFSTVLTGTPVAEVRSLALQPDGKVLLAGTFSAVNGTARSRTVRLNADGTLDSSFAPVFTGGLVNCIQVLPDGRVLMGGTLTASGGASYVVRLGATGVLDTAYRPGLNGAVHSLALQADGSLIVAGEFTKVGVDTRSGVARLNADGTLDSTFNPKLSASFFSNLMVWSAALQSDGRVVLGGKFQTTVGNESMARLQNGSATSALTAGGSRVEWLRDGTAPEILTARFELSTDRGETYTLLGEGMRIPGGWELTDLALPAQGQIRALGRSTGGRYNGSSSVVQEMAAFGRVAVPEIAVWVPSGADLQHQGSLDLGVVHPGSSSKLLKLTIKNKGESVLADLARSITGPDASLFSASPLYGAPLSPIKGPGDERALYVSCRAPTGKAPGPISADLHIASNDPDEPDFVIHLSATVEISSNADLASLSINHSEFTTAFQSAVTDYSLQVPHNKTQASLQTTTVQEAATIEGTYGVGTAILNESFSLDVGSNSFSIAVTAQDGVTNKTYTVNIIRADATVSGDADITFDPQVDGNVDALACQPDGRIIIGGSFQKVSGVNRSRLARLNADGTLDISFSFPDTNGPLSSMLVQADGKIVVGGGFSTLGNATRWGIARLLPNGAVDTTFTSAAGGSINALAQQKDGQVMAAGSFSGRVRRFQANGARDATFAPSVTIASPLTATVDSVTLQPDGKVLLAGTFDTVNSVSRISLARLNAEGTLDTAFNPSVSAARGTLVLPDGKILVRGSFSMINGESRVGLARLNADGTLDSVFDAALDGGVDTMAVQADGKIIIAGAFTRVGGTAQKHLARLHVDGALDSTFQPQAFQPRFGGYSAISGLALLADGSLLACGRFDGAGGHPLLELARLINDPATSNLTVVDRTSVRWMRGGTAGEADGVTFDVSTDGGTSWAHLGQGARVSGGWTLSGLSLPASGVVRALASQRAGKNEGSAGLVEARQTFSGFHAPQLAVAQASKVLADDEVADFGNVLSDKAKTMTLTLKNTGTVLLENIDVSLDGAQSAAFAITRRPPTTLAPGKSAALVVRFSSSSVSSHTAALHIRSNDLHFSPFDINLQATVPQPPIISDVASNQLLLVSGLRQEFQFPGVGGPQPLTYQWRRNGIALAAQKDSVLKFHPAKLADAGVFTLTVSNPNGRVTSDPIYIGVIAQGLPIVRAKSGVVVTLTFQARAPNGSSILPVWYRLDGSNIVNYGEGATLRLGGVGSVSSEGIYFCSAVMKSGDGVYSSNTATNGDTLLIIDETPVVSHFSLPPAFVGQQVSLQVPATGNPTRFSARGLPPGMTLASNGMLSGKPLAAGFRNVLFTASNLAGSSVPIAVPWTILPLPAGAVGSFAGLVDRAPLNDNLGGYFAITTSGSASFTGYLMLGGERIPVAGVMDTSAGGQNTELRFKVRPYAPESVLVVDTATQSIAGELEDGLNGSASSAGLRNIWSAANPSTAYVGRYNAGLVPPSIAFSDATTYPQGTGYVQMSVLSQGAVTWIGHQSDGSVALQSVVVGPRGELPLHSPLYLNQTGSLNGWSQVDSVSGHVDGVLDWSKQVQPPASRARSYAAGFPLHELTLTGAKYTPPTPGTRVLGLLPSPPDNAKIVFSSGGFVSAFPRPFSVTAQNTSVMPMLNPLQVNVFLAPPSGTFTGSFTLTNNDLLDVTPPVTLVRRVTVFQGALITRPGMNKGVGYFNLAELPNATGETLSNTPQWSGKVELGAP